METKQIIIDGLTLNYSINENGEVYNTLHGKFLKPQTIKNGYKTVTLSGFNFKKQMYIHKLMMNAFCPECNFQCVNHKDLNKGNNILSNLEWCTYSENIRHSIFNNPDLVIGRGKKKPIYIIAEEGKYYCESISEAARHLQVDQVAIHNYLRGFQQSVKGLQLELA